MTNESTREELLERIGSATPPVLPTELGAAYFVDAHLPGAGTMPADQVDVRVYPGG